MTDQSGSFRPAITFRADRPKLTDSAIEKIAATGDSFSPQSAFEAIDSIIMIVDDEILNIEMTQAFLEEAGYSRFICTHQSEHAVDMIRRDPPHVLLLDLSMPKVSGLEILAELHEDENLRHIPVIVLTSSADGPTKLKALGLGATDFLAKPVDPSELALRLRNTLAASAHREYLINHDALTGLPNQTAYVREVERAVRTAALQKHGCALLHIGVDRLSQLQDALGRTASDIMLKRMANSLEDCVESAQGGELGKLEAQCPRLYRFDSDEFAVVVPFLNEIESAAGLITSLMEAATTRFKIGGNEIFQTASIGVAVHRLDGDTPSELTKNASLAMRHAMLTGNTYEFFTRSLKEKAVKALLVGADIRRALLRDEFSLRYQPKIQIATNRLTGADAVLRWTQADGTVIEGYEIFQMAFSSDMATALVEWMLAEATRHTVGWQSAGLTVVPLGIKVSLRHLTAPQILEVVSVAMTQGAKAKLLCLELSSASALQDAEALNGMTVKLRQMGFRLALDNFGTADAPLSDLSILSIDEIKLDACFMKMVGSRRNAAVLRATMALARDLSLTCVVTDVQNAKQLSFLKEIKADQCQGTLFSDSMPAAEFASRWLVQPV
jgi:diguanylate cyclase (GGDEF)-like protein